MYFIAVPIKSSLDTIVDMAVYYGIKIVHMKDYGNGNGVLLTFLNFYQSAFGC